MSNSTNGELDVNYVSQDKIDEDIERWTGDPEKTIVVCATDPHFKDISIEKNDNGQSGNSDTSSNTKVGNATEVSQTVQKSLIETQHGMDIQAKDQNEKTNSKRAAAKKAKIAEEKHDDLSK